MVPIDSYQIYYHSAPSYKWQAMVDFYFKNEFAGRAFFMKTGESLPANRIRNGKPVIHFPVSELGNLLLVMTMDKPVYLSVNESNGIGYITTSNVSEGDLDARE